MSRWHILGWPFLVIIIGGIKTLIALRQINSKLNFTDEYLGKFGEYVKSNYQDGDSYTWLIHRSSKMQKFMGSFGVMGYKPAGMNYMATNYPIVLNMIPEIRQYYSAGLSSIVADCTNLVQDAIVRYHGALCDYRDNLMKSLINALKLFRKGIETIVFLPLTILVWIGVLSTKSVSKISQSIIGKILVGLVSIVTILSTIVSLVTGWEAFVEIVSRGIPSVLGK